MNQVAGVYVVAEKLNGKPNKFTNRRVNKNLCWKERIEKEINELRGEMLILYESIKGVKVKSRILINNKEKM